MKKINWLVTDGKISLVKNQIKYLPMKDKDSDQFKFVIVNSDVEFENGEIQFILNISDVFARCQVVLNSDTGFSDFNIGLNVNQFLFGMIRWDSIKRQWEIIQAGGCLNPL